MRSEPLSRHSPGGRTQPANGPATTRRASPDARRATACTGSRICYSLAQYRALYFVPGLYLGYSLPVSAFATYPGTVSPLRGLNAFTESEREVFYGRDQDVEALTRLVTGDNYRAGLLHGESGVGKTSLLRAGLVPHLRDHGYQALYCRNILDPIQSLASELTALTGQTAGEGETPLKFLTRVVADAMPGQLFILILDDVEQALTRGDEAVSDLGNLFARVMGRRYGGRARFLYCCSRENVYQFDALEQRTGSLFPPTNRYELQRLSANTAHMVLSRTLALAGIAADDQLARAVVDSLGQRGPILPADLQIAARALIDLDLKTPEALKDHGGPSELEGAWMLAAAEATGNQKIALRVLAELASRGNRMRWHPAEWAASRASVEHGFATQALSAMASKGLLISEQRDPSVPPQFRLAHPILAARIRELAAPARASSRRAHELLGSKVDSGKRLSLTEIRALKVEGIAPSTPREKAVVDRSRRFYYMIMALVVATPLIVLAIIYASMSGRYYLDVYTPEEGGVARVVVRAGRPGLSSFNWLPASPSFGSMVADTGLTRAMVSDKAWDQAAAHDIVGDLDDYTGAVLESMAPRPRLLMEYATSGQAKALDTLHNSANTAQDKVILLESLVPISRDTSAEVSVVEGALKDPSPSVQRGALRLAAAAAKRKEGAYHKTLAKALTSPDPELRRLAAKAARELGEKTARVLYQAALATNPEPSARRELLDMVTTADVSSAPSAASAASILVNRDLPTSTREKARTQLERSFAADAAAATLAAAKLASDPKAPVEDRILSLQLMRDHAPADSYTGITDAVKEALGAKTSAVRAAALPLYARIDPKDAAAELVLLPEKGPVDDALKVAMALSWGEIAKTGDRAATVALEKLLEEQANDVRAAAAEAYGNTGRSAQSRLAKMVKTERFDVASGAAYGLANSAAVSGRSSVAVGGVLQLWKRKGRARRVATQVFAKMARTKPRSVISYLTAATRAKDDSGLHVLGARGLCNANTNKKYRGARKLLAREAKDGSLEVRRVVMACIADHSGDVKTAATIANRLADDGDIDIRSDAARVLARLVSEGKGSKSVARSLASLAADDERAIRKIAIRALAELGAEGIPRSVPKTLARVFRRGDEEEKISLLRTADKLGANDLIQRAIADESPGVRIAALDAAIATGSNVPSTLNAALTDADREVRSAALERLSTNKDKLEGDALEKSLSLAIRDTDQEIAQLALTTLARLGDSDDVIERLGRTLALKSESQRARAASACIGLVERDAEATVKLLTPLLDDPSHDVRAAMLPALATAWNATHTPEQLTAILRDTERHAMKRITATAAFLVLARTEAGREAALAELSKLADDSGSLVGSYAALGKGLIESSSDGIEFLQVMTP